MTLDPDFEDFIRLLNEHSVDYMLVGGYAVGFHGYARTTADMDIWIEMSPGNAVKMMTVLEDFGFGSLGLTQEDFLKEDRVVQLGYPPLRIDILTSISGVSFQEAFQDRISGLTDKKTRVYVIHINRLIANKIASGRDKDLLDAKRLQKMMERQSKKK